MSDDDAIKGRNDFPPPVRLTSMPPQGKVWQVAGPVVTSVAILIVTFAGALTGHVSNDFLEKTIGWVLIGMFAASTPRGVLDTIKAMVERNS